MKREQTGTAKNNFTTETPRHGERPVLSRLKTQSPLRHRGTESVILYIPAERAGIYKLPWPLKNGKKVFLRVSVSPWLIVRITTEARSHRELPDFSQMALYILPPSQRKYIIEILCALCVSAVNCMLDLCLSLLFNSVSQCLRG
jgi:hypothetical protein